MYWCVQLSNTGRTKNSPSSHFHDCHCDAPHLRSGQGYCIWQLMGWEVVRTKYCSSLKRVQILCEVFGGCDVSLENNTLQ